MKNIKKTKEKQKQAIKNKQYFKAQTYKSLHKIYKTAALVRNLI